LIIYLNTTENLLSEFHIAEGVSLAIAITCGHVRLQYLIVTLQKLMQDHFIDQRFQNWIPSGQVTTNCL